MTSRGTVCRHPVRVTPAETQGATVRKCALSTRGCCGLAGLHAAISRFRFCSARSTALLVVAQAWLLADVVSRAFSGDESTTDLKAPLSLLLAVVLARATVAWYTEVAANRSSSRVKSQLREAFVEKVAETSPSADRQPVGELATLATHGIDALDGYFSRYLPQLVLAVIVPSLSSWPWRRPTGSPRSRLQ